MTTREENRAQFSFAAQLLDDLRVAFPNARVLYAEQDGRRIGRRESGGVAIEPGPYPTHALAKFPKELRSKGK